GGLETPQVAPQSDIASSSALAVHACVGDHIVLAIVIESTITGGETPTNPAGRRQSPVGTPPHLRQREPDDDDPRGRARQSHVDGLSSHNGKWPGPGRLRDS